MNSITFKLLLEKLKNVSGKIDSYLPNEAKIRFEDIFIFKDASILINTNYEKIPMLDRLSDNLEELIREIQDLEKDQSTEVTLIDIISLECNVLEEVKKLLNEKIKKIS